MSKQSSLFLLLISTLILTVVYFFINKTKNRKKLIRYFDYLLILLIIWNVGLILQLTLSSKLNINPIYFDYITYFGIANMPIALYHFVKTYINPDFKKQPKLLIVPTISLIMLYTNDLHHLFYKKYSTVLNEIEYGPFLYIHLIYTYSLVAISLILLLRYSIKNKGIFATQSFLFLIAICIPALINVLGLLNIFNGMDIYLTPISFTISFLLIAIAIFKYDFLNINTIALQLVTDTISDSYLILDNEDFVINYNKSFLKTFKVKESDIMGKNVSSIFTKNELDDVKVSLALVKENKKKVTFDKYLPKMNKYFNIEISPIFKEKRIVGTLIYLRDITEREHDKQQIKANQDLLVEQERLASLGQMIGGIAHNLKTPIFSIAGGLEGLSDLIKEFDESIDDPQVTNKDMHDIAKDMNDWIVKLKEHNAYMSDVITTVKGQTVTMSESQIEKFSIKELFDHVLILMQHELKEKLVKLNTSNDTPYNVSIYGNINSLVQVINNLISNAIEAYSDDAKNKVINLSATYDEKTNHITISVQDFGPGLPESIQDKIFKEMVTTKGKYGTGLGLFMSYSNIKAHFKGNLSYKTEKNKGTTFFITLPCK